MPCRLRCEKRNVPVECMYGMQWYPFQSLHGTRDENGRCMGDEEHKVMAAHGVTGGGEGPSLHPSPLTQR
jgi:hypothetical protein